MSKSKLETNQSHYSQEIISIKFTRKYKITIFKIRKSELNC